MKHITLTLEKLKQKDTTECSSQLSLLERVLAHDPNNARLACILALDMFLVGIDTVSWLYNHCEEITISWIEIIHDDFVLFIQTSAAVASILYQLSLHQDKQDRLYEEISRVIPRGTTITSQKLDELSYLRACIKETLRYNNFTFFF